MFVQGLYQIISAISDCDCHVMPEDPNVWHIIPVCINVNPEQFVTL